MSRGPAIRSSPLWRSCSRRASGWRTPCASPTARAASSSASSAPRRRVTRNFSGKADVLRRHRRRRLHRLEDRRGAQPARHHGHRRRGQPAAGGQGEEPRRLRHCRLRRPGGARAACGAHRPDRGLALFQRLWTKRGAQGPHGVGGVPRLPAAAGARPGEAVRRLGRLRQRRAAPRFHPRRRRGGGEPLVPRAARPVRHLQLRHRTRADFQPARRGGDQLGAGHAAPGARAGRQGTHRVRPFSRGPRRQVPELHRGRPVASARRRLQRPVHAGRAGRRRVREGAAAEMNKTIEDFIGDTPLVRLQRLPGAENFKNKNIVLAKLEGNNPAGSVKDRPAISMIRHAEKRGRIKPGDTLIEPTSGNTGIALAMAAATRGYRMVLIMPEHLSAERRQSMRAFGAEIILTPQKGGMEAARDLADKMVREGEGTMLDQFANPDNPLVHYETTGPEIWRDTEGGITHFVSSMGTTGTIMGCSRFFKEKNRRIEIIGCQPEEGSQIPGIRKWPEAYLPKIYDRNRVDRLEYVSQAEAEEMTRRLAREEGIFAGISSGGAVHVALRVAKALKNALIVTIICDRGDRYLTTGVFPD